MSDTLTDAQWCVLDLLMRARQKGCDRISRMELLASPHLPDHAKVKLVFAALTIPGHLVRLHGRHDFEITPDGAALYNLRFGDGANAAPTRVADAVICLPDLSGTLQ